MARKELGHVELEWICPHCSSRNKGRTTTCAGCGSPQPPDVQFIQPGDTTLIDAPPQEPETSPEEGSPAEPAAPAPVLPGLDLISPVPPRQPAADTTPPQAPPPQPPRRPDVHCPFCGVRNPGEAQVCRNCGGDLAGAQIRETGQVVGAYTSEPSPDVTCPACGTANPARNLRCGNCGTPLPNAAEPAPAATPPVPPPPRRFPWVWAVLGIVICLALGFLAVRLTATEEVSAVPVSRSWTRQVQVQQFGPVSYQKWESDLPAGAREVVCEDKFHHTSDQPAPQATEVCGTPYVVDEGDGTGKVIQDCQYQVYEPFCRYTVDEWTNLRLVTLEGTSTDPAWPEPVLANQQRLGEQSETYVILFETGGQVKEYTTSDVALYQAARTGSNWRITVNGLGAITSAELVP